MFFLGKASIRVDSPDSIFTVWTVRLDTALSILTVNPDRGNHIIRIIPPYQLTVRNEYSLSRMIVWMKYTLFELSALIEKVFSL